MKKESIAGLLMTGDFVEIIAGEFKGEFGDVIQVNDDNTIHISVASDVIKFDAKDIELA